MTEATHRYMPHQADVGAQAAAGGRHVNFHHDQVSFNGTTHIEAELDLADALDLDTALPQGAEQLRACGSTHTLDVRRAMAAGEIARHQLALDLDLDLTTDAHTHRDAETPWPGGRHRKRRARRTISSRQDRRDSA